MAEKRKPGRPPKMLGLSPPLKRVVDHDALQDMRDAVGRPQEPILPQTRQAGAEATGEVRVFAALDDPDSRRHTEAVESSVPGIAGPLDTELRVSALIRKIMAEAAALHFSDGQRMSNAEALTRQLVNAALEGKQFAIEAVLDRYEGKPVRANVIAQADLTIEDQIDRQSVALLNQLADSNKEPSP